MSLIHWWPLNGNTNDLGISPCTVSGTPTFNAAGKIGQCLSGGTLTMPAAATAQVFNKDAVSVCFWLYNGGSAGCIFGTDPMTPPNNRRFTLFQYPTANDLHWSWQNEDSGGTFTSGVKSGVIPSNAWTHICAVWDHGTARIYVNGAQVATSTGTCTSTNWSYDTVIARPSSTRYYNDIRIYNHALSAKEVKEISKGLVLHYNFEDEYIEPTTNIDPAKSTAPSFSYAATKEKVIFKGKECWHFIIENNGSIWSYSSATGYAENSVLTRSCWLYIPSGQTNRAGWYGLPFAFEGMKSISNRRVYDLNKMDTWQYCYCTGTAQSTSSNYLLYMLADGSATAHRIEFYITDIQLEEKDYATPYVNGTRSTGKVYDNSGYGNNGTVIGSCQIKSDSAAGKHSIYSPAGANYVERQNFPVAGFNADQQFTINAWIKIVGYVGSDWNTIFRLAATNARDQQLHFCYNASGNIILSQFSDDPQFTTNVVLNTWAMVTWVHYKDGSTAKCKYFVNGQQVGNTQSYSGLLNIQNNARLTLFYDSIRNSYGANLHIGDFKIYSTALSADDIKAEYSRKAAIDKNGNLFTGELVETTYNLLTSENLLNGRVNTSATSNVGEIVTRNGYFAYRVSPVAYWSGDGATSKNICKGQFGSGQYIFDLWIDVDEVYYDGNGRWVPGGFEVYYTDGSVDNIVIDANSTQGHSGYQHLIRKTNANKTISGLGVYYYIGVPVYIRCDSVICKVNSDEKICKNNIIAGGQFVEQAVSDSKCKLTRYGVVSNAIKEL